jgi:hypothetical protein
MKYVSLHAINYQHVLFALCHHHQGSIKRVVRVLYSLYSCKAIPIMIAKAMETCW